MRDIDPSLYKIPPQNLEVEQTILGSLLLESGVIDSVLEILTSDDFYSDAHRKIYSAIVSLSDKKEPVDIITLSNYLKDKNQLDSVGGMTYVASLVDNVPSAANVVNYSKIIKGKSVLRGLIGRATEIINECYETGKDINDVVDSAQKSILEVNPLSQKSTIKSAREVAKETFEMIEKRHNKPGLTGISSGLSDYDEHTGGLQPGEMTIIAARPSMGKSCLSLNIAHHAAMRGLPALVFSVEMPNISLMTRILASMTNIESRQLRKGRVGETDWARLANAASRLSDIPLYFDDSPLITPNELRIRSRKAWKEYGIELIVVDYLQILTPGAKRKETREREVSESSMVLKSIARELNVPVIAVSQLNRGLEQRPDKRPLLSDLRESGQLEQDADVVAFIYRDEVYDPDSSEKGIAEINIAKQRNGPLFTIKTAFSDKYQIFRDLTLPDRYGSEHGNFGERE